MMEVTRLSSKGQVIIPKALRVAHQWEAGEELIVTDLGDGILLRPKKQFLETKLTDVAGCLAYKGKPKTTKEMNIAIDQGWAEQWHDSGRH